MKRLSRAHMLQSPFGGSTVCRRCVHISPRPPFGPSQDAMASQWGWLYATGLVNARPPAPKAGSSSQVLRGAPRSAPLRILSTLRLVGRLGSSVSSSSRSSTRSRSTVNSPPLRRVNGSASGEESRWRVHLPRRSRRVATLASSLALVSAAGDQPNHLVPAAARSSVHPSSRSRRRRVS